MEKIFYLIYISEATTDFRTGDLNLLLQQSRTFNAANSISGMLLYVKQPLFAWRSGRFIQLLEGSMEIIQSLLEKIKMDGRHKNVTVLQQGEVNGRAFPDWSMGWEYIENDTETFQLGFTLDKHFLETETERHKILRMNYLKNFYAMTERSLS